MIIISFGSGAFGKAGLEAVMVSSASQKKFHSLDGLLEGRSGVITGFDLTEDVVLKLMEMGLGKGRSIRFIRRAPLGDPLEVEILRYRLAIRRSEARGIRVRLISGELPVGRKVRHAGVRKERKGRA